MASCAEPIPSTPDSIDINPLSELNKYENVRVLGSGGFGKVYHWRLKKVSSSIKDSSDVISGCSKLERSSDSSVSTEDFAAKVQGFNGSPIFNRREASVLKRLSNSKVVIKHLV